VNGQATDVGLRTMDLLTIAAIFLSPVVALLVSVIHQSWKEKRDRKFLVFLTLYSTRHKVSGNEEYVKALNAIDVVFNECAAVRAKWKEYYELLNQPQSAAIWADKYAELLRAIARDIGYKNAIDHQDLNRVYVPQWMYSPDRSAQHDGT